MDLKIDDTVLGDALAVAVKHVGFILSEQRIKAEDVMCL